MLIYAYICITKPDKMKTALLKIHQELVQQGRLQIARRLLHFLLKKKITLSFSDEDFELEQIFDKLELTPKINSRNWLSTYFLNQI